MHVSYLLYAASLATALPTRRGVDVDALDALLVNTHDNSPRGVDVDALDALLVNTHDHKPRGVDVDALDALLVNTHDHTRRDDGGPLDVTKALGPLGEVVDNTVNALPIDVKANVLGSGLKNRRQSQGPLDVTKALGPLGQVVDKTVNALPVDAKANVLGSGLKDKRQLDGLLSPVTNLVDGVTSDLPVRDEGPLDVTKALGPLGQTVDKTVNALPVDAKANVLGSGLKDKRQLDGLLSPVTNLVDGVTSDLPVRNLADVNADVLPVNDVVGEAKSALPLA